jgi:hypothetical protein
MKGKGKDATQGHLAKSTSLLELRDDLINNWDIHYSNPEYRPLKNFSGGPVDRTSNRQIYKKHFTQVPLLKNLVDTFETMVPYLPVDMVWLLLKSKEGDGFQGWHKYFLLGQQITKTIVINVGSKERDTEKTTRSFDNNLSFEADDWKEIEVYALSGLNLEDKFPQDEQKPAAIPTKNPSVKPSLIPHLKPSASPVAIPHKNSATILPEDGKNDDNIAEDERKPVANQQEEMLTTEVQAQFIQSTIPSLPAIAGNVVAWICEFCDSQWPQSQNRCGSCKRWKGWKRSLSNKKDNQEQTVSKDKEKKRGRKSKTLPPIPAQEVDIPLVVGSASCSPLTGGINANDSSIGQSIGMSSYDDATIGDNTVSQDTNDELI